MRIWTRKPVFPNAKAGSGRWPAMIGMTRKRKTGFRGVGSFAGNGVRKAGANIIALVMIPNAATVNVTPIAGMDYLAAAESGHPGGATISMITPETGGTIPGVITGLIVGVRGD